MTTPQKLSDEELALCRAWCADHPADMFIGLSSPAVVKLLDHIAAITAERDDYRARWDNMVKLKQTRDLEDATDANELAAMLIEADGGGSSACSILLHVLRKRHRHRAQ